MSGHTPGPWAIELDMIRNGDIDVVADGLLGVAQIDCRRRPDESGRVPRETALANARLVSVAPDLLDSVKVILGGFEKGIFVRNTDRDGDPMWLLGLSVQIAALAKAQRAIAKAEGREP